MSDYSRMDEALEFLAPYGPALANGFTNHAPMVCEALARLGRAEAVMPWLASETANFLPRPHAAHAITDWQAGLGNGDFAAWSEFFVQVMERTPWAAVLAQWAPRLMPGHAAAAAHGVIRAGHAARSLAQESTSRRRRELAEALGYWASCFRPMPDGGDTGGLRARDAIARVPRLSTAPRPGAISARLSELERFAAFGPVIGLIDVSGDPDAVLSELIETFVRVYLANARDGLTTIVFIHGVTGAAALRAVLPHLAGADKRDALRRAWQTGAALWSAYGREPASFAAAAPPAESAEDLIAAAVKCGDDHAIKFTDVCVAEYSRTSSPALLAAARHAIGMLGG